MVKICGMYVACHRLECMHVISHPKSPNSYQIIVIKIVQNNEVTVQGQFIGLKYTVEPKDSYGFVQGVQFHQPF